MKAIPAALAIGLCAAFPARGAQGSTLELEALIAEALERDPGLQAHTLHVQALRHRIGPAGALPDPMVRVDLSNVPTSHWDFDSTPMSGREIGLTQRLPWPGKRARREHVAHVVAEVAREDVRERQAQVVLAVKHAFFDLAFLDQAIATTERSEASLRDIVRIAQTKYAVGSGLQQDVLKAQVSLSRMQDRLVVLRSQRLQATERLNAARFRALDTPLGPAPAVRPTLLTQTAGQLGALAVESRPSLAALRRHVEHWQAAERLARIEGRPDFEVRLAYRQRSFDADPVEGSDFVSASVGMSLPLWRERKQQQEAAEARVTALSMEARYAAHRTEVELRVRQLYRQVAEHRARMELLRTATIPQARQALTASLAAYQVDRVDFLHLLDSQISLLDFEIDEYRHLTEAEKGLAAIEAEVGTRVFSDPEVDR